MVGKTVSHYEILSHLGSGGMGDVYKAHDTHLDRLVALKFLPPHLTSDPEAKERFMHEAKAASALQHANICVIHDFDNTPEGQLFIAMEYLEGTTLKSRIENGRLKIEDGIDIALQVARGLARAHENGIVHRDIKPANIMVTSDGVAKIVDFGLAKLSGRTMVTQVGSTIGTVAYMSPEQARGDVVDARTDIWSLGVVLFEMLTGKLPFRGEHEAAVIYSILNENPPSVRSLLPEVPASVDAVCAKCLQKLPSDRYSSMGEAVRALTGITHELSGTGTPPASLKAWLSLKNPKVALAALVLLLGVAYGIYWFIDRSAKVSWARGEGVTELVRLVDNDQRFQAFTLARRIERYIPDDPLLLKTWPRFSRYVSLTTDPPGARVFVNDYQSLGQDWTLLGTTPLSRVLIPTNYLRVKCEKEGYASFYGAFYAYLEDSGHAVLDRAGSLTEGMIRIPGGKFPLNLSGLEHVEAIGLGDYLIDKYEVTNKEYKRFVDAGGYQKKELWKEPFLKNGKTLTWAEALNEFKDKTGRPGPATWEVGNYPEGQADFPVAGISWYEAAAYSEFAGKSLPTIFHWNRAAYPSASSYIVAMSNFREKGPDPVGKNQGIGAYGNFDMAGNVREWCWNADGRDRFILGGGWNDQAYMFTDAYTQHPFDRSPSNGVRCVKYLQQDNNLALAMGPMARPYRDFLKERIASDQEFEHFRTLFAYDKTDLKSTIESSDTTEEWIKQKITFDAAYGNERVIAYLFLPPGSRPPYQTVVYFPGSNVIYGRSSAGIRPNSFDFVIKSGRAVLYPIYKGIYERNSGITTDQPSMTNAYKDWIIQIAKDLGRSVDYLETRPDIDKGKLAYYGLSWGGRLGVLLVPIEKRFKTSVFYVAGLKFQRALPEVDPVNYASRIKVPVLMLNGRQDSFFPLETSQIPLYKMLGTPAQHKRHVVYETGHFVPRTQLIKEVLDWLDRYLGPVGP